MRTIKIDLYTINELSEDAQQQAFKSWLNSREGENWYWNEAQKSLKALTDRLGIKIIRLDYENDYSKFIIKNEDVEELRGKHVYRFFRKFMDSLEQPKTYYATRVSRLETEISCPLTGSCYDESLLKPIIEYLKCPYKASDCVEAVINDCLFELCKDLHKEEEYRNSFEAFKESAEANRYEYEETGMLYTA